MSKKPQPPALDPEAVEPRVGSGYPAPFDEPCRQREKRAMGDALRLTQFGVNLLTLPPGAWSGQRHWHKNEDEFVYLLEGEVVLISDAGAQVLTPGMAAGFPAGKRDGHHLVNRSDRPAKLIEVGTRAPEEYAEYADIDMKVEMTSRGNVFKRKNGAPY